MFPQAGIQQEHPFVQKFKERLPAVLNSMVQTGQMTAQEAQVVSGMAFRFGPGTQMFLRQLISSMTSIDNPTMDNYIVSQFLPNVRIAARQAMMSQGAGMMYNASYGSPMGGGMMGMQGGFGMRPMMGGVPTAPMFNNGPAPGATPMGGGMSPESMFSSKPVQQPQKLDLQIEQPKAPEKKNPWSKPEVKNTLGPVQLNGVAEAVITDYQDSNGDSIRRISVYDPRIRYLDDHDALRAYKTALTLNKKPRHQILTVAYRQLKVLQTSTDEFTKLATAVSTAILKNGAATLEQKIRTILNVINNFQAGTKDEFIRLFLDELDAHCQCGELVDEANPTRVMGRFSSLEQVLDLVTNDFDKATMEALNSMAGFAGRMEKVIGTLVDAFIANLHKFILHPDPDSSPDTLDDLSRALPQLWSEDGNTLRGTDDLIDIYIASGARTSTGTRTDTASAKDSELRTKLRELCRNFTVVFVDRVVTWCNYSASAIVKYDVNDGSCIPTVFGIDQQYSDMTHFLNEVIVGGMNTKRTAYRRSPHTLYCEFEESTTELQYGLTTDDKIIVLSTKGWK